MPNHEILQAATLLLVLLNPFLLAVYLLEIMRRLDHGQFAGVIIRAGVIAGIVFLLFAALGDVIFRDVLKARYASFLVFGGIVFLIICIRFVFRGPEAVRNLRGTPKYLAGRVAMPFMIGPGTINASALAGSHLELWWAAAAIAGALLVTVFVLLALKVLHDVVAIRYEELVTRYLDIAGRIAALLLGAIAVEMIFGGIERWLQSIGVLSPTAVKTALACLSL